jgi:hypothetical protein
MRLWAGVALGIVLLVAWVLAHLVMKITSMAIHLLVIAAVVVVVLNVVNRVRHKFGSPTSPD